MIRNLVVKYISNKHCCLFVWLATGEAGCWLLLLYECTTVTLSVYAVSACPPNCLRCSSSGCAPTGCSYGYVLFENTCQGMYYFWVTAYISRVQCTQWVHIEVFLYHRQSICALQMALLHMHVGRRVCNVICFCVQHVLCPTAIRVWLLTRAHQQAVGRALLTTPWPSCVRVSNSTQKYCAVIHCLYCLYISCFG